MRARTQHTDAILLRSVDYGESDRIVTLLTATHGKIALIARGARRSRKRFASALEPFALLDVEFSLGTGSRLGTLAQAHAASAFPRILGNLGRMGAAGSVLELVREAVPEHEADAVVYATTAAALVALDAQDVEPLALLTCFHARVMALVGFAPRLGACGLCGRRPSDAQASAFDPREGQLVCRGCGGATHRLNAEARGRLRRALGAEWVEAASSPWPRRSLDPAYRALRAFAEHRLGRALPDNPMLASATARDRNGPPG